MWGPWKIAMCLKRYTAEGRHFTPSSCKPVADGYSRKKDVVVAMLGTYAWSHQNKEVCWSPVTGLSRAEELVVEGDWVYPDIPWQRC